VELAIEPLEAADLDEVLALNQANTPHVGDLGAERLAAIVDECSLALVARDEDGRLAGFVLVLAPGAAYDSPNYRWFSERYDDFRYVDRIAVDGTAHRSGLGRRLYGAVFDHARDAGAPIVAAEVNVEPPNPVSTAFHTSCGFAEVGRQDTYGGSVTVSLMTAAV
jgi:predicted GNAT superfamily acetyltransferase